MIVSGTISVIEGDKCRLDIDGGQTGAIPTLGHVRHFSVDFDNRVLKKEPVKIGDKVVAYFEDGGYYNGYIIGLLEE